jgi:tetratricopeptide (TPR) repeat protein
LLKSSIFTFQIHRTLQFPTSKRFVLASAGLWCLAVGFAQTDWCTQRSDADELKLKIQAECGSDLECIADWTKRLIEHRDCYCREVGYSIDFYFGFGLAEHDVTYANTPCDRPYVAYRTALGARSFQQGELERAMDVFWQVLETGEVPGTSLTNVGAVYFAMGQFDLAAVCFEQAWVDTELNPAETFMVLNNLTAIHMQFRQWEEALRWVLLTRDWLVQNTPGYDALSYSMNDASAAMVEANEWIIRLQLGEVEVAESLWKTVPWGSPVLSSEQWLNLMFTTAERIDAVDFYPSQIRLLVQLAKEYLDASAKTIDLGAYEFLLQRAYAEENSFEELIDVWKWTEASLRVDESLVDAQSTSNFLREMDFYRRIFTALGLAAVLIGVVLAMRVRRRFGPRAEGAASVEAAFDSLRNWHKGTERDFIQVQRNLEHIDEASRAHLAGWLAAKGGDFTDTDVIILRATLMNQSPKDIARANDWSPSYVYKIRSQLRIRLETPDDESFESWLNRQIQNR